jgi:hypothetical protein
MHIQCYDSRDKCRTFFTAAGIFHARLDALEIFETLPVFFTIKQVNIFRMNAPLLFRRM